VISITAAWLPFLCASEAAALAHLRSHVTTPRGECWRLPLLADLVLGPERPLRVPSPYVPRTAHEKEDLMFRNILVAFDGSDSSRRAYETALDIAKKYDSAVHVVAVARPPEFAEEVETKAVIERERARLDRQLEALRVKALQAGLSPHLKVVTGHTAAQIIRATDADKIDLIVLGHRGHGVFDRWVLGSVSREVIAYTHCPVMVVR
jgi:nucleotide-binding universal stress UspA family protein